MTTALPDDVLADLVAAACDVGERLAGAVVPVEPVAGVHGADVGARWLDRWRRLHAAVGLVDLDRRLALDGWDVATVAPYLGPVRLAPGTPLPPWATLLRRCVDATVADDGVAGAAVARRAPSTPFADVLTPSVTVAEEELVRRVGDLSRRLAPDALDAARTGLLDTLVEVTVATFATDFEAFRAVRQDSVFRVARRTAEGGTDVLYRSYVDQLRAGRLVRLLRSHPALGRFWGTVVGTWVDSTAELLGRIEADAELLRATFGVVGADAPLAALRTNLSDRHHGGRTVAVLEHPGGPRVVHKPRGLALERDYNRLLEWLSVHGAPVPLRPLRVVDRGAYGWVEAVEPRDCTDRADVAEHYRRVGALLCVVHVLEGTDCHLENVIAVGPDPVLVDGETLLHPWVTLTTPAADDGSGPDAAAWRSVAEEQGSVARTGLLPRWGAAADGRAVDTTGLGAFGDDATLHPMLRWDGVGTDDLHLTRVDGHNGLAASVPALDGVPQSPVEHAAEVRVGFLSTYLFLRRRRAELLAPGGPVSALMSHETRVLVRDSGAYGQARLRLVQPGALADGVAQTLVLEPYVAQAAVAADRGGCLRLVRAESAALRAYDIPHVRGHATSTDLLLPDGERVTGAALGPAADSVRARLARLGSADLRRQLAVVDATLAARALVGPHAAGRRADEARVSGSARADPVAVDAASPDHVPALTDDQLVVAAVRLGEGLAETAVVDRGAATWVGLDYDHAVGRYVYQPVGPGLYAGRAGIALFLAALRSVTGEARWRRLALAAVPRTRRTDGSRPAVADAGEIYGLVRVATLLDEGALLDDALAVARRLDDRAVAADTALDVLFGSAGAVLALLALHEATGDDGVLARAVARGDHLLRSRTVTPSGHRVWAGPGARALTGFSHGAAGIAHALLRLAHAVGGDSELRAAGLEGLAFERALFDAAASNWPDLRGAGAGPAGFMVAWCHGATGIGMSRLAVRDLVADDVVETEVTAAVQTTLAARRDPVDQVCCGGFGRIELLLAAGVALGRPDLVEAARTWASERVLAARRTGGYHLVRPLSRGSCSPGFHQGAAGVGFQLLRLTAPDHLPSVLARA